MNICRQITQMMDRSREVPLTSSLSLTQKDLIKRYKTNNTHVPKEKAPYKEFVIE
eukprot:gene6331-4558_t